MGDIKLTLKDRCKSTLDRQLEQAKKDYNKFPE